MSSVSVRKVRVRRRKTRRRVVTGMNGRGTCAPSHVKRKQGPGGVLGPALVRLAKLARHRGERPDAESEKPQHQGSPRKAAPAPAPKAGSQAWFGGARNAISQVLRDPAEGMTASCDWSGIRPSARRPPSGKGGSRSVGKWRARKEPNLPMHKELLACTKAQIATAKECRHRQLRAPATNHSKNPVSP